jgi:putative membrane protein
MLLTIGKVLGGLIGLLHVYIMVLEMFLIKSRGQKAFGLTSEQLQDHTILTLFFNQGAYNGVLAAGIIWSFFLDDKTGWSVRSFFLLAVLAMGIVGGASANPRIYFIQAIPAAIALMVEFLARRG